MLRKSDIAAAERIDLFPTSLGWKPKVFFPPNVAHVSLIVSSVNSLVIIRDLLSLETDEHNQVSLVVFLMNFRTLRTALPNLRIGHKDGSFDLRWVLRSSRSPFFSSSNTIVIYSASNIPGSWGNSFLSTSRNMTFLKRSLFVIPGFGVFATSQILQAKKKPPMIRSIAWSKGSFSIVTFPLAPSARRNFGVRAFCCSTGGPVRSKALKSLEISLK